MCVVGKKCLVIHFLIMGCCGLVICLIALFHSLVDVDFVRDNSVLSSASFLYRSERSMMLHLALQSACHIFLLLPINLGVLSI